MMTLQDIVRVMIADDNFDMRLLVRATGTEALAAMRGMSRRLGEILTEVKTASGSVDSASQAMAAATSQMSQGATQQATAAEEARLKALLGTDEPKAG